MLKILTRAALDDMTARLLRQAARQPLAHLTAADVQHLYVEQATRAEWNAKKHAVMIETINKHGIRPGHGKWA